MMTNTNAIVPGSLAAVARSAGMSLAESFLNCEVICLIDQSGSMAAPDAPGGRTRFDAADDELRRLQANHPGQVAVVSFSEHVQFCPSGVPDREGHTTDMVAALTFVRVADGATRIVLISDGEPDEPRKTLATAAKFTSPIHTIYIGPEDDHDGGRKFLQRLAAATGGQMFQSSAPGLLASSVDELLLLPA